MRVRDFLFNDRVCAREATKARCAFETDANKKANSLRRVGNLVDDLKNPRGFFGSNPLKKNM